MWKVKDQNLIPINHLVVTKTHWNLAACVTSDEEYEESCVELKQL